jgi:predicted transcriptional regulator
MLGKVDTAASILELTTEGASTQYLKNRTDLSGDELENYLTMLESKDLIRILKSGSGKEASATIKITKRGIQFLNLYGSITAKYLTLPAK